MESMKTLRMLLYVVWRRLDDPRAVNPAYVFLAGLGVILPVWYLLLRGG